MNIIEATKKALAESKWIYRASNNLFRFKPTDTHDCYLLKVVGQQPEKIAKRWNPKAEDVLADDYMIAE